jgi:cardiolipin synthase
VIDDEVFVGSANLDTRSLWINYELVLNLKDALLASQGRQIFEEDLKHSKRIEPATWKKSRTFLGKLKEGWAYFILARVDPYMARRLCKGFE